MEYNKTKRGLELGAVITALIYCSIVLLGAIILFNDTCSTIDYLKSYYGDEYFDINFSTTYVFYFMGFFTAVALFVVELVCAYKLLDKPKLIRNDFFKNLEDTCNKIRYENKKATRITFIVFSSILAILLLITTSNSISTGIIGFLTFAAIIVLESVSMRMKDVKEKTAKHAVGTVNLSIEQKIAELKHLKKHKRHYVSNI